MNRDLSGNNIKARGPRCKGDEIPERVEENKAPRYFEPDFDDSDFYEGTD